MIGPKGVGDLRVMRQALSRYAPGEIAHIENVMRTESRSRDHRRLLRSETSYQLDAESETENTRDQQSTERFELENETSKIAQSQESFEAGVAVSSSLGPVTISAHADYSTSSSRQESQRAATKYAKEMVDKAIDRVKKATREQRRNTVTEETEELNHHGFDNTEGTEHVRGLYRWVDKLYFNKIITYGRRLMYEIFVPEPASFYLYALGRTPSTPLGGPAPEVLDPASGRMVPLTPELIEPHNYLDLVARYRVPDVEPPPPASRIVTKSIARLFDDRPRQAGEERPLGRGWALAEEIAIPAGYSAAVATVTVVYPTAPDAPIVVMPGSFRQLSVILGKRSEVRALEHTEDGRFTMTFGLAGETATVPLSIVDYSHRFLGLTIEITCLRTPAAMVTWQMDTFNAVVNSHQRQSAQTVAAMPIEGRNPASNRQIEAAELKRQALLQWLGTYPLSPAVDVSGGEPRVDGAVAEENARWIRFFEDAFDWANMTYTLLPYLYGSRAAWPDVFSITDRDPLFEAFIRAGAARVMVPVHVDATAAVLFFQRTGLLWEGPDAPTFAPDDPEGATYTSMLLDLEDETDVHDLVRDVPMSGDDPEVWEVKVPTSLVWLQGSMDLEGEE